MTVEQFKAFIKTAPYIVAGSEIHQHMHETADNARKITADINGSSD